MQRQREANIRTRVTADNSERANNEKDRQNVSERADRSIIDLVDSPHFMALRQIDLRSVICSVVMQTNNT